MYKCLLHQTLCPYANSRGWCDWTTCMLGLVIRGKQMKCAYQKAIEQQWLKTKAVTLGANAVIDTIINDFKEKLEELPEEERATATISVQEFFDYMNESKKKFQEEMGVE